MSNGTVVLNAKNHLSVYKTWYNMTSPNSYVLSVYFEYFITDFLTTLNGSGGRNNGRRGSYDH